MSTTTADDGPLQSYFEDVQVNARTDQLSIGDSLVTSPSPPSPRPASVSHALPPLSETISRGKTAGDGTTSADTDSSEDRRRAEFEERFKYLVCSSGILEKEYLPGLGGDDGSVSAKSQPVDDGAETGEAAVAAVARTGDDYRVLQAVLGRWDFVAAGGVLLLALGRLGGLWVWVILAILALGSWAVGGGVQQPGGRAAPLASASVAHSLSPTSRSQCSRDFTLASLQTFLAQSHELDQAIDHTLVLLQPHDPAFSHQSLRVALHRLTGDMTDHLAAATSSLLELVDKRELAVLGEMYDISTAGRSFHSGPPTSPENSSDAESDLPAAFAVSVPSPKRAPFFFPTSITPSRLVDQQVDDFSSSPMTASRSLPGQPRTRQLPFATRPQLPGEDRFTLLPSRTPRISKRSSWDAEAWRAVQSEESAQRPRHARRITEADEDEGEDDTDASLGESLPPAVQSPFSPRFSSPLSRHRFDDTPMITPPRTALLDLSLNGTIARPTTSSATSSKRSAQTRPTSIASSSALHHRQSPESLLSSPFSRNDQIASMPVSPTYAHQSTPNAKRRSLQLANRHHRQSHSLSIPASANPKRRSLQNMHYYPPDPTIGTPGADLTRANSMPSSELQAVRAASATGSRRSSGASQRPDDWSIATPAANRRLKRITSISPLTTPGLKAGCLGLHLRRRRVGCCLLGLRFEDTDAYWEEVNSVLSELERGVTTELHALKAALGAVSQRRVMANDVPSLLPPWASASTARNSGCDTDFAPRDSDEALLASRISESRRALMDAWRHLDETEAALRSNLAVDSSWTELRESIGAMVRAWEKGREAARRVSAAAEEPGVGVDHNDLSDVGEPTLTGVPDFIATWRGASDEDTGSTSLDTDRPLSSAAEDEHEHGPVVDLAEHVTDDGAQEQEQEQLPPPGEDVLYEAVSQAGEFLSKGKAALREMSRDARIGLAKQARERGMPLADLLDLEESAAAGARREAQRMREAGDRVVQELRGMMGLIKDKKRSRGGWKARQAEADGASQAEIDGGSLEAADPSQVEFDPPAEDDGVPQAELLTRSEFSEAMPVNARVGTLTPSGRMERVSGSQRVSVTEVMGVAHVSLEGEHVSRRLQGRGLGFVFPALSRAADEA